MNGDAEQIGREYFLRLLCERDDHLADLYVAGERLLDMERFGGRSRLLAHAVREIRRDLPALFARTKKPKKLEHHQRLEEISERWKSEVRPQLLGVNLVAPQVNDNAISESLLNATPAVSLPSGIGADIDALIVDDAAVSVTLRQQVLEMCNEVNREVLRWGGNPHLARRWMDGLKAAESLAHKGGGATDEERAEHLFRELQRLVLLIFQPAPERERISRGWAESATSETVLDALTMLVTMPDYRAFYENLRRPDVLPKLRAAGEFRIAEGEAEPAYWPQADYLANVASDRPTDVADILASLRATNPGIVRQLLAAAARLPDAHLARLAERAKWLDEAQEVTLYCGYLTLMERLARAGKSDVSFKLGASLLRLSSERDPFSEVFGERDRAVPIIGSTSFEDALNGLVSALGSIEPLRTMALLADVVDGALAIEGLVEYDMSSSWMPDILDTDAGRYFAPGQAAGTLADLAIREAEHQPDAVLAFLDGRRPGRIYERITLAVIYRCGLRVNAVERLMDDQLWLRRGPEHLAIVQAFYPALQAEERAAVFDIAHAALEPWYRSWLVDPESPRDDDEQRVLAHVAASFGNAVDAVPEPHGSRLRAAIEATRRVTPPAPPNEESLASMSPPDIVAELRRWEATATSHEPWTLGQTVRRLVEQDTAKWLSDGSVSALSDRYLGWALHGLRNQRNASKPLYDAVTLAVVEDAIKRADALAAFGDERDLADARALAQPAAITLVDLARDIEDAGVLERIVAAARTVGRMAVAPDQQGSPFHAPSGALGDPHALAVMIAGGALNAAARHNLERGAVLDLYDENTQSSAHTVRAALGREFPLFAAYDEERAEEWAAHIFFSGDERADQAAWAGYVLHAQLTLQAYRLLRPAYVRRITEMQSPELTKADVARTTPLDDGRQVYEKTLAHAWALAWSGVEPVARDGSLIRLAVNASSPELLSALLRVVASNLARPGPDKALGNAIVSEAMRLWDVIRAGVDANRYRPTIITTFASWSRLAILPASWRLAEIEWLLTVPDIDLAREWDLVQGLIDLAEHDRLRALRTLRDLVRRRDVSAMTATSQYAGPLLRSSRAADAESALLAVEINSILMNNFYRDLLGSPTD